MRTAKQKARSAMKRVYQIEMRENPTPAESYLWEKLKGKQLGVKFTSQAIMFGFIVDFWCGVIRLAVEVDGPIHEDRQEYDAKREEILRGHYVHFLRFTNDQVFRDRDQCVLIISAEVERLLQTRQAKRRITIERNSVRSNNVRKR